MKLLTRTAAADAQAVRCARCDSGFRPALTAWACPVCGWEAGRPEATTVGRWLADPGNRIVALVAAATAANAILLLVLAIAVQRSG